MEENFIVIMFVGHGGIMTEINGNSDMSNRSSCTKIKWKRKEDHRMMQSREEIIMPKFIDSSANISLCSFAVPTETCNYPDDEMMILKNELLNGLEQYYENMTDDIFKDILHSAQLTSPIGFRYGSDDWAPHFTKRPSYAERWIHGNTYVDKMYSDDPESSIDCGIYILQNNIGLENGSLIRYKDNGTTLGEIIGDFELGFDVNKFYILDTTCSVVYNPELSDTIKDQDILDNIFECVVSMMRGGKNKKNKNKSKKNKSKKNKSKKNKSKKNKSKK